VLYYGYKTLPLSPYNSSGASVHTFYLFARY